MKTGSWVLLGILLGVLLIFGAFWLYVESKRIQERNKQLQLVREAEAEKQRLRSEQLANEQRIESEKERSRLEQLASEQRIKSEKERRRLEKLANEQRIAKERQQKFYDYLKLYHPLQQKLEKYMLDHDDKLLSGPLKKKLAERHQKIQEFQEVTETTPDGKTKTLWKRADGLTLEVDPNAWNDKLNALEASIATALADQFVLTYTKEIADNDRIMSQALQQDTPAKIQSRIGRSAHFEYQPDPQPLGSWKDTSPINSFRKGPVNLNILRPKGMPLNRLSLILFPPI